MTDMSRTHYDIAIVGGGMVGATLALAIKDLGLRIAIIDPIEPRASQSPSYDDKSIALSLASQKIFTSLSLWPHLQEVTAPIQQIHVSDKGHFGFCRLSARKHDLPAFGYVVPAKKIGCLLLSESQDVPSVNWLCPASVTDIRRQNQQMTLSVMMQDKLQEISADLVVAADGGNSLIRRALNITAVTHDDGKVAIGANISVKQAVESRYRGTAFERFTQHGPIALLPHAVDKQYGLIWSLPKEMAATMMVASERIFLSAVQATFGYRLGQFVRVGKRSKYPLISQYAEQAIKPGVVLLGNSAHMLHPIAGQGFNLSLRDIGFLAQVIKTTLQNQASLSDYQMLLQYQAHRALDQHTVKIATEGLVKIFSGKSRPLMLARNLGLCLHDIHALPKRTLARFFMGRLGEQSVLASGRAL